MPLLQVEQQYNILHHIGHLSNLEGFDEGRIDDFFSKPLVLRAADMSNEKMHKSDHNEKTLTDLLATFNMARNQDVDRLALPDDKTQMFYLIHPVTQMLML